MAEQFQPINCTASTLTLNADTHHGAIVTINRAAGCTVTLPASVGKGATFRVYIGTTLTGNGVIAALGTDIMQGSLAVTTDIGGTVAPTTATTDKLTMSGSTTGGLIGSYVELVDVVAGTWLVRGSVLSSGTEATPFSET